MSIREMPAWYSEDLMKRRSDRLRAAAQIRASSVLAVPRRHSRIDIERSANRARITSSRRDRASHRRKAPRSRSLKDEIPSTRTRQGGRPTSRKWCTRKIDAQLVDENVALSAPGKRVVAFRRAMKEGGHLRLRAGRGRDQDRLRGATGRRRDRPP